MASRWTDCSQQIRCRAPIIAAVERPVSMLGTARRPVSMIDLVRILTACRIHNIVQHVSDIGILDPIDSKPESLSQLVYTSIRKAIVSKVLMPGTVVSEAALAQQLTVSKTPVREALLRLQAVGLVEQDGGRGLRVVLPSEALIRQAYEVRWALEGILARLAAQRADPEEQESIAAAAAESLANAQRADIEGFRHWDRAFHRAVADAAANPRLAELADDALSLASVLRERDVPDVQDAIRCARQHFAISNAIRHHRSEDAAAASEQHVRDVQQMVLDAFLPRISATVSLGGRGRTGNRHNFGRGE